MTIRQGNKIIAGNINVEDYNTLQNKPQINSVELSGNKTLEELGIQASGDYALKSEMELKADKADTLAGYGITDGLSTSQITNCITKIPQDIKLELNDGTLTLKAGSKVYVPNGVGVFDIITLSADKTTQRTTNGKCMVFINRGASFNIMPFDSCYSGSSAPTITTTYAMWYDTANNKIKWTGDNGSSWTEGLSLPLAVITVSNGAITSIDQVFNGFGYIGNTLFALPGIKGLIPNGFNTDGSLNSIEGVSTKVNVYTRTKNGLSNDIRILFQHNGGVYYGGQVTYDDKNNFLLNYGAVNQALDAGSVTIDSTGRITSLTPNTAFHAVDRNDTQWASTQGKPSNKYVDLTLGATGSSYKAPANGYFLLNKSIVQTEVGEYINIWVNDILWAKVNSPISHQTCLSVSVKKGDVCRIDYSASGETNTFKFCYDEGVK